MVITASLGVLTKQGTFKYNKILLEIKNKLHEIKALKSCSQSEYMLKIKRNAEVLAHIYHITKAISTRVHKSNNKLLV